MSASKRTNAQTRALSLADLAHQPQPISQPATDMHAKHPAAPTAAPTTTTNHSSSISNSSSTISKTSKINNTSEHSSSSSDVLGPDRANTLRVRHPLSTTNSLVGRAGVRGPLVVEPDKVALSKGGVGLPSYVPTRLILFEEPRVPHQGRPRWAAAELGPDHLGSKEMTSRIGYRLEVNRPVEGFRIGSLVTIHRSAPVGSLFRNKRRAGGRLRCGGPPSPVRDLVAVDVGVRAFWIQLCSDWLRMMDIVD